MDRQRFKIGIPENIRATLDLWAEADNRSLSNLLETIVINAATEWEAKRVAKEKALKLQESPEAIKTAEPIKPTDVIKRYIDQKIRETEAHSEKLPTDDEANELFRRMGFPGGPSPIQSGKKGLPLGDRYSLF